MGWLILSALVVIIIVSIAILKNLQSMNQTLHKTIENDNMIYKAVMQLHAKPAVKPGVTDPFKLANKTNTPGASSSHIIRRKSPDQIRAENYEKLKNGGEYGHSS